MAVTVKRPQGMPARLSKDIAFLFTSDSWETIYRPKKFLPQADFYKS
jgi:hypothetical protein